MKFKFTKKKFMNILIIILIVLFSSLLFYELYNLAYNYSKSPIIEGLTLQSIIIQPNIDCSNIDVTTLCNAIVTDISNIQILDQNISNISSAVNSLITNTNNSNQITAQTSSQTPTPTSSSSSSSSSTSSSSSSSSQTQLTPPTLKDLTPQPQFSCSLQNNSICSAIINNITNINIINTNIQTLVSSITTLPNAPSDISSQIPPH